MGKSNDDFFSVLFEGERVWVKASMIFLSVHFEGECVWVNAMMIFLSVYFVGERVWVKAVTANSSIAVSKADREELKKIKKLSPHFVVN